MWWEQADAWAPFFAKAYETTCLLQQQPHCAMLELSLFSMAGARRWSEEVGLGAWRGP